MKEISHKEKMKMFEEVDRMLKNLDKHNKKSKKMLGYSVLFSLPSLALCVYSFIKQEPFWFIFNIIPVLLLWISGAYFYGKITGLSDAIRTDLLRIQSELMIP